MVRMWHFILSHKLFKSLSGTAIISKNPSCCVQTGAGGRIGELQQKEELGGCDGGPHIHSDMD